MSSTQEKLCEWCGKLLAERQAQWHARFCNKSCSAKWRMRQPEVRARMYTKEVRAKIGQKKKLWYQSGDPKAIAEIERIRLLNPTERPEVRAKISKILREMGHKPHVRGGNGRPMPVAQRKLLERLGEGWKAEYAQPIKPREKDYPTHYKIDIANPSLMIAIEVDGYSHMAMARRALDAKKDAKLRALGWKVLRFTNRVILDSIDTVMQQVALYCTT